MSGGLIKGITVSCPGFYGPQGRVLRFEPSRPDMIEKLSSFRYKENRITNFEMETGAMYGLARVLGHYCCSVNLIVANRITHQFSHQYKEKMNELIKLVLDRI
jgi:uridine phosphorylase